ncbi:MAG TPA: YihY/virulence factor BrkB family protein [Candidatus Saccharimonadales bacterium]|nr:YihY/virulence factor BrkB family protein [Candidatus Saccharimonadales bacterium]
MSTLSNAVFALPTRFDRYQRRHRFVAFAYATIKKYLDDQAGHTAALLAYYGFLSLFPLLLVLTTTVKLLLLGNSEFGHDIIQGAVGYFPVVGGELQRNLHGFGTSGLALAVGVLLTLYGTRQVADCLRIGLDHLWQVPYVQRSSFPGSLLRSMSIIVVGGLGLAVAPLASGYSVIAGHGYLFQFATVLTTLAMLFGILLLIIRFGLSVRRPLHEIWLGAALAAIGLEVLQTIGGYIMARELQRLDSLYGTFALVLGVLYWLYLQAQVLLLALEVDTVRVFRLWPRSIRRPLTTADYQAYELYRDRARFHDPEAEG